MGFERFNSIFWQRKSFLMCGNKKKSLGAKSGLCGGWPINSTFWPVNKALIWADVWELALSWWTMIRLLLVVFRISPQMLGKQILVYHLELTVPRCSSGHMTSFAEEIDHHLHRSDFSTNYFRWSWLVFEDQHDGVIWKSAEALICAAVKIFPLRVVATCASAWKTSSLHF